MRSPFTRPDTGGSFLPRDYVAGKAERRATRTLLVIFTVVMVAIVSAFMVTSQQWNDVRRQQRLIDASYAEEQVKIQQLRSLEEQRAALVDKAEVTTALIDRVPRSVLLAEIVTRMPGQVTLLDVVLESKRIRASSRRRRPARPGRTGAGCARSPRRRGQTPEPGPRPRGTTPRPRASRGLSRRATSRRFGWSEWRRRATTWRTSWRRSALPAAGAGGHPVHPDDDDGQHRASEVRDPRAVEARRRRHAGGPARPSRLIGLPTAARCRRCSPSRVCARARRRGAGRRRRRRNRAARRRARRRAL